MNNNFSDKDLLNDIYYVKHNYDGAQELYKKAKITNKNITISFVKEWLSKQSTHQETKQDTKKKVYLPIYSETPFAFQIDLTFFQDIKNKIMKFMCYLQQLISIRDMLMLIIVKIKIINIIYFI